MIDITTGASVLILLVALILEALLAWMIIISARELHRRERNQRKIWDNLLKVRAELDAVRAETKLTIDGARKACEDEREELELLLANSMAARDEALTYLDKAEKLKQEAASCLEKEPPQT